MSSESDKVVALRRLLAERFPAQAVRPRRVVPTGVPAVDDLSGGGLLAGTLTEFVSGTPSGGCQLSLGSLLLGTRCARQRLALVDAAGSFDLDGIDDDAVAHMVWVRCGSLASCWRAADLLARDPNYAVVAVDVRGYPERELLRTRDGIWVRLQRAAEQADTALLIQTPTPCVPNAAKRFIFDSPWDGNVLFRRRSELIRSIRVELHRTRSVAREVSA